jgi:hypothetical protein
MECFLTCFVCFFISCMMRAKNNQQIYSTQIFLSETACISINNDFICEADSKKRQLLDLIPEAHFAKLLNALLDAFLRR